MISFGLEDDQRLIQETVRKLAAEQLRPSLRAFEARGVPDTLRRQFHELGLGLIDVPEAYGGHGAPLTTAVIVHEELAYGDPGAAVALCAPHLVAPALLLLGDEAQRARWLGRFAAADGALRTGALCWSERDAPVDGFATTARRAPGGWRLDGHKAFVVNGGQADVHVVFAQVEGEPPGWDGVGAFVVAAGSAGLRAGPRHALLGLEAVPAYEVLLEGCVVPDEQRLRAGGELVKWTERLFARAMLITAARQVGLARAAYELALDYTQERKAFGKPVAHFQAIAFALADMATEVEAARWMVWKAASELDAGGWPSTVAAAAHANEAAWRVADQGVQLLGGAGYVKDHPVEKWLRDTKALALFAPPSEIADLALAGVELGEPVSTGHPSSAIQPFFT
jgi:alkylation response protein AidB-like acyl-CoA dehydrogenase